ncbi:MAG: aminotransferase class I/II-fold pyridoxal phosphate-dependent enzyme [Azospirillum sp.]|nr:aminotransferase class I/II-fold pyridoxal phosphate-dependent enzyme [Azospirillum sp.]
MPAPINRRLDRLSDYPFTRLAALLEGVTPPSGAAQLAMSVGEPQHVPPPLIAEVLQDNAGLWGKYPPVAGTPEFRAAAGGWLGRRYRLPEGLIEPQRMVLPVAGTREALFLAALLAVPERKAGQVPAVLMPNPFYAVYEGAGRLAGGEPVFLAATRETGFLPDLDAVPPALLARTALFYLCTPGNPQGAAAGPDYLAKAIRLSREYDFVLCIDECYAEIYDSRSPAGALEAAAGLAAAGNAGSAPLANLLVFHSLSKRSSAAGLRSGFVVGDPDLIGAFARLRGYANAGTPLPVLAAAAALWRDDRHVEDNRRRYRLKFDAAEAALGGRFGFYRPDGGFFLWLEVGDGEAAARRLWADAGIRVLPGAYLARPGPDGTGPGDAYIRVALVHEPPVIALALGQLAQILR